MSTTLPSVLPVLEREAASQIALSAVSLVQYQQRTSVSNTSALAQQLTEFKDQVDALTAQINKLQRIIAGMESASRAAADRAQASAKANVWGVVGAVVAVVVAVVVATVTISATVYAQLGSKSVSPLRFSTFGFFPAASSAGHPLASEFAALLARIESTSRTRVDASINPRAALQRILDDTSVTSTQLASLAQRIPSLKGPCAGDPRAVYDALAATKQPLQALAVRLRGWPSTVHPLADALASIHLTIKS